MDEAQRVLERLERVDALEQAGAPPCEVLDELTALVREAEAWSRVEGGDAGVEAVGRLRSALARAMIAA
jgi:hypothetical protein